MPDTGMTNSDPELTLDDVGQEFPDWHCYAPGVNGVLFASLRGSAPLVVAARDGPCDPARRNPLLDGLSMDDEIRST